MVNLYPEAGDANAVALIKSSFRDGEPEAAEVLKLSSDTNLTGLVRNLAIAEYVRREELDTERIISIPTKDWKGIDYVTFVAMPPSKLGFQVLSQFLHEYPKQQLPEGDLAFICAQYLCKDNEFGNEIYKNLITKEWSSSFVTFLFHSIMFCDERQEGELAWNAKFVLSECVLNEFHQGKLVSRSRQLRGRFDDILEAKKIQLEVLIRASKGPETALSPASMQNRYITEFAVNKSRRKKAKGVSPIK